MHRIVYLERESIIADVRRPDFPHHWVEHAQTLPAAGRGAARRGDHCDRQQTADRRELIAALPALQMVAVAATGTNNVDLDACRARGIVVSNIRGYAVHTVPEHVFALLLALVAQCARLSPGRGGRQLATFRAVLLLRLPDPRPARRDAGADRQRQPRRRRRPTGRGFRHARAAQRAQGAQHACVRATRRSPRPCATADAVSLHCPLTAETTEPDRRSELRAMKRFGLADQHRARRSGR
jgi:glycerate dehydrogenase